MRTGAVTVVLGICAAGVFVECSPFGGGGDFVCQGDQSCTGAAGGRCEPDGFCSFADPTCTDGQRYSDGPQGGQCVGGTPVADAAQPTVDAPVMIDAAVNIDSAIDAAPTPYCVGQFVTVCLPQKPSADYDLPMAFSTDSGTCRNDVMDSDGQPLTGYCVVAGANVSATSVVTGSRPLIVISTNKLTVGALDVASHRTPLMSLGAGGDYAGCATGTGGDGTAGGGGGGGAFAANGGKGGNRAAATGGTAGAKTAAITALRGGCPGGNGSTPATRGHGGGAVLLIAASTIQIDVELNASGSSAASAGNTKELGGSGGGSGGLLVLEAPQITNTGLVLANGGGAASGSSSGAEQSNPGSDPMAPGPAAGGKATQNAGDGGNGGDKGKPDGTDGADGALFMTATGGAGGGGGGVGAILTHVGQLTGGMVSPTPATF